MALGYVVIEHGVIGALDPRAVYNDPADIAPPLALRGDPRRLHPGGQLRQRAELAADRTRGLA